MRKTLLCCLCILVLAAAAPSGGHAADHERGAHGAAPSGTAAVADCEARIGKLESSPAEGAERLAEKQSVIEDCAKQYRGDKTIGRLVRACAKYAEQPVLKQQFVAACQLAAFNYAIALYALKAEYRK